MLSDSCFEVVKAIDISGLVAVEQFVSDILHGVVERRPHDRSI